MEQKPFKEKLIYQEKMKNNIKTLFKIILLVFFCLESFLVLAAGKIYGKSKTVDKEYTKYELCRLKKVEVNMKDGKKDGFKCIFKRQLKGKDVTVFQPTAQCMTSFKCKREIQD